MDERTPIPALNARLTEPSEAFCAAWPKDLAEAAALSADAQQVLTSLLLNVRNALDDNRGPNLVVNETGRYSAGTGLDQVAAAPGSKLRLRDICNRFAHIRPGDLQMANEMPTSPADHALLVQGDQSTVLFTVRELTEATARFDAV